MQKRQKTHYEILGLTPQVTTAEIKVAYRELVKKCHPDIGHSQQSQGERIEAHQNMKSINEAYETLMDANKRLDYDYKIGATFRSRIQGTQPISKDTDLVREKYLKKVFNPSRRSVVKILKEYKSRLSDLSQDIYDDILIDDFARYVEKVEKTLLKASNNYTDEPPPESLAAAVQWMRHSIAQAADGLDELNFFLNNYDYDHLSMAGNLFKIAIEHSKVALNLTKV